LGGRERIEEKEIGGKGMGREGMGWNDHPHSVMSELGIPCRSEMGE